MPTRENNFLSINNNYSRIGAKTKAFFYDINPMNTNIQVKKNYSVAGMYKPFFNKQCGSSYESAGKPVLNNCNKDNSNYLAYTSSGCPYSSQDPNAFRARPMKHYRLQYNNTNDKQSYRNRYLISTLNRPGGYITSTNKIDDKNGCNNCVDSIIGIEKDNLGKINKIGKYNTIYFKNLNEPYTNNFYPNEVWGCNNCPNITCDMDDDGNPIPNTCSNLKQTCINICDPEKKAKKRVVYGSRINRVDLCEMPYYQNYNNYLKARCKTYIQNSIKLLPKNMDTFQNIAPCLNDDIKACLGKSAHFSIQFRSNCPEVYRKNSCNQTYNGAYSEKCNVVYYKPNNAQYAQQGGVSSSSRILRLKLNTINKNAQSIGNSYGSSVSSALSYSGRSETPFVQKQKMNAGGYSKNCDHNLYHLYRPGGGNPTTSCLNNSSNNRIIGHFCKTSIYPTQVDNNFQFMKRQPQTTNVA